MASTAPERSTDWASIDTDAARASLRGSDIPSPPRSLTRHLFQLVWLAACAATAASADVLVRDEVSELKTLGIQELLDVSVTSVSRRPQKYADAAAALFVISREDIRRSGAASIPELLRMVPGVQVARVDSNKWAISARGFNARYSSKLLVQMDGRTLYSPLYSGVYWDVQDTVLDDIERIEVIRGPGATLWGANAVNGIINIITRSAHDTENGLLTLGVGDEDRASGTIRYGRAVGDTAAFRVYAKGFERDASEATTGGDAADDWRNGQVGFRSDLDLSTTDSLTLQGDYYNGNAGAVITRSRLRRESESNTAGGNLLARWTRQEDLDSGMEIKAYFDQARRSNWTLSEVRDTIELDLQRHTTLAHNHLLVWGAGYRSVRDDIDSPLSAAVHFNPSQRIDETLSAFIQDDIALARDRLHLIIGSKLERNDYTGWEVQPNIRLLWSLTPKTNLWAAISRALRTTSRFESDVTINVGRATVSGNSELTSERLNAFELGLRTQPAGNLSLDLSLFFNDYDHLVTYQEDAATLNTTFANAASAQSHGIELASNWDITSGWRLKLSYSWLKMSLESAIGDGSIAYSAIGDSAPRHQFSVRSWFDLRPDLELDFNLYSADELVYYDTPAYLRLDVRLGWRPAAGVELSLTGSNLLDETHQEFSKFAGNSEPEGLVYTLVERSVQLQAKWSF